MAIKNRYKFQKVEKILTTAGITLIAFVTIAELFGMWHGLEFISEPLDVVYDLRYLLLLVGGYFVGYILQPNRSRDLFMFHGVSHGLFAIIIFFLLDMMRAPLRGAIGILPYPWEKIMFLGLPLISLGVVAALIFILKKCLRGLKFENIYQKTFVVLFVVQQIGMIVLPLFVSNILQSELTLLPMILLWLAVMPLSISIVTYILLKQIGSVWQRLFYSSIVGTMYFVAWLSISEFSTNPMSDVVEIFGFVSLFLVLATTSILIWCVHKA